MKRKILLLIFVVLFPILVAWDQVLLSPITTTDATATNIVLKALGPNETAILLFVTKARASDGTSKTFQGRRSFKRVAGGAAALVGTGVAPLSEGDAGATAWTAVAGVNGNNAIVTVTGAAATIIIWSVQVFVL